MLKTRGLLDALKKHDFDAAFGGARRDEEKSRAKERFFSVRDEFGQWDPKNQRPELWSLYNAELGAGESVRVFPLSNWTELDVWQYIKLESIPLVPLYFARPRPTVELGGIIVPAEFLAMVDPTGKLGISEADVVSAQLPLPQPGLHPLHGGRAVGGRRHRRHHRRGGGGPPLRAREPHHRPDQRLLHGAEEARGVLLVDMSSYEHKSLLRFTTSGSVDDGKSTLIGRLLYETNCIFEDQYAAVARTSEKRGDDRVDLALLLDGLAAEREQGITIDVAYRYFTTAKRKFIIADTPGHEQYTRNMVTGASTSELAIILIDARHGVMTQSRRHGFLISLLQIPHLVVAVNKMDLVDWRPGRVRRHRAGIPRVLPEAGHPRHHVHPHVGAWRATT